MYLLAVGLSHKTAPVEQREKAALSEPAARSVLRALVAEEAVSEAVALSTCNRTELYVRAADGAAGEEAAVRTLLEHTAITRPELECALYTHRDERAAAHLFRVVTSVDSMVIGESEIQGQVREAFEVAQEEGACGALLDRLFRQALEVGKRVRRETAIGRGAVSISSVAVELAREAVEDLATRHVLVIGAGQVAEATAGALVARGVADVAVANRTVSTARALAARIGGRGIGFDRVAVELAAADIVISSTDAPHPILSREDVERAMAGRRDRPMVLIDIAVPRDLDAAIQLVPGVILHDIDDLERVVEANMNGRLREAERAEDLLTGEVHRFAEWRGGLAAAPTISSLHELAESIRRVELERVGGQWESLSAADRERVEALTRAIVGKLLHEPTVRVREAASDGDGLRHVESLRHLFGLAPTGPSI